MGTGITEVIGGHHDFLPDRSDEFQKLCNFTVANVISSTILMLLLFLLFLEC
jgi:hypothetical protein